MGSIILDEGRTIRERERSLLRGREAERDEIRVRG